MPVFFLLDKNGAVTDSILTREQISGEKRSRPIGKGIDKGLAGWVKQHLSAGLVMDTKTDARWTTLPGQSYIARSALAVPVLRHDTLFGIITLMHSLPSYFDQASVDIVQHAADQMALIIENAKRYRKLEQSSISLEKAKTSIEKYPKALKEELKKGKKIFYLIICRKLKIVTSHHISIPPCNYPVIFMICLNCLIIISVLLWVMSVARGLELHFSWH